MKWLSTLREAFGSLRGSPRELLLVYLLKFCESYAYFSFSIIFTLYVTEEFGMTDEEAGVAYGLWGALISAVGVLVGFIIDNLGVRRSLILGFAVSTTARVLIALTESILVLKLCLFGLLPLGLSMGIPVLSTGIRRYTTTKNRGFAFGVFYATMNIAALLSGWIVDALNIGLKGGAFGLSSNRLVLLTGAVTSAVGLAVAILKVREIKLSPGEGGRVVAFQPVRAGPMVIVRELCCSKTFWRYLALVVIMVNLRMIFRHLDATLPKYLIREFGEDVPKGSIYSINPFMIIFLVPIVSAITQKSAHFSMILRGSWISGVAVFPMAFSTTVFSAIVFVVILSLGEALWSPRFYDYTVSVAPEGREGTFMALASAPLFAAKLPVGALGGFLLAKYCPEEGERESKTMWLIIGLITFTSPVLVTLFQRCIREPLPSSDVSEELEMRERVSSNDEHDQTALIQSDLGSSGKDQDETALI